MIPHAFSAGRPDAMADAPGPPDLTLTRAVVQYRERHEIGFSGSSPGDIGVALVLEGRYAASTSVVDLGSALVKELDLSSELVVLGWVQDTTLGHVHRLLSARVAGEPEAGRPGGDALGPYCFGLALRVLGEVGFSSITRPSYLRIGFRDLARDLEPDGGPRLRLYPTGRGVVWVSLDAEHNALRFEPRPETPAEGLGDTLTAVFPWCEVRRVAPRGAARTAYGLRLPLPASLAEVRDVLARVRVGISQMIARFEPERYRVVEEQIRTFGIRDTLARLSAALHDPPEVQPMSSQEPAGEGASGSGVAGVPGATVH